MDRILITGASGFIGSFIVEEALSKGMEVWAAVRKSSSRAFLTDNRIHFIQLTLSDASRLCEELQTMPSTTLSMLLVSRNASMPKTSTR